jgi:hypothetical protein
MIFVATRKGRTTKFSPSLAAIVGSGIVISWPPRSGSVIQDYRSKDQDPKEIIYGSTTLGREYLPG